MLTIKQIAEMANVSRATVSRVLNDSGYVSVDARKRVLETIEKTGYVPSQHAKSLRTKQTKVIGVILPKISTETSSRVVDGLNNVFQEYGYHILLTTTNLESDKEIEYLRLLKSRQVDGIILLATNTDELLAAEIEQLNIPVVAIGQEFNRVSCVVYDDYHAARDLTQMIIDKGYRKIAFIGVDEADKAVGYLRKKAFLDVMAENGLNAREEWLAVTSFDLVAGYEAMKTIIEQAGENRLPEAVFAVTDRLAIGAMQYLKEKNIRIPQQIGVAGIGASDLSRYVQPALTTVEYYNKEAGIEGARMLLDQIRENSNCPKKIVLGYRLIVRGSI